MATDPQARAQPDNGGGIGPRAGAATRAEEDGPEHSTLKITFNITIHKTKSLMQLIKQAAAERININATDLNCLNILSLTGQMTAGQLAVATGLTTASITGVVDRLEQAGYVRRERDARDRRRVVIHLIFERAMRDVEPVFRPMVRAWQATASRYSEAELKLILEFQSRTELVLREHLARLRGDLDAVRAPANP